MSFHLNNRNQYFIIKNVIYYSVMSCNMSRISNQDDLYLFLDSKLILELIPLIS